VLAWACASRRVRMLLWVCGALGGLRAGALRCVGRGLRVGAVQCAGQGLHMGIVRRVHRTARVGLRGALSGLRAGAVRGVGP